MKRLHYSHRHHRSPYFRPRFSWISTFFPFISLILMACIAPQSARTVLNAGNPDAKRLYDDLLSNYNKLVRPVINTTDPLLVRIKLKLSQLIDVNLKNQIMTTNLWVEQYWFDYKLKWDPEEYGGVRQLHVPSDHIWRPDIVLYNNADGNFEVTLATKATLWFNGLVEWKPPAIYKSSCEIDVEYFPFDEQTCVMKFGSWTYDGFQVDLRHMCEVDGTNVVPLGIDLSEFYMSVEWDILEVPAVRNEKFYTCCDEPYLDITFNITMRRKTLFYTVNLIIPCMGISFLTVLTFYLPSDSGEKVTLSISILTSLYVFFLLVVEIIPPTSLVVPLLGKYLIFAMILVSISICVTVVVLNVHFRSPQTHKMAPWVKRVFIHILPRLLIMRRPQFQPDKHTCDSRSLRKVMMRTCIGAETSTSIFDNTFSSNDKRDEVYRDHFHEPFPEDIPGIPQHRPSSAINEFSPRVPQESGMFFSSGCQVHGTSVIMDEEDEEDEFNPIDVRSISADDDDDEDLGCLSSPMGNHSQHNNNAAHTLHSSSTGHPPHLLSPPPYERELKIPYDHSNCSKNLHKSCACVNFIAEHTRAKEEATKVKEDWKYVAMVLDRLFLWIFTLAVLVGTAGIILQAPSLYDDRIPIDREISDIASGFDAGVRKKESKGKFRSIQNCYPDQDN